jgi:hypothetical protein
MGRKRAMVTGVAVSILCMALQVTVEARVDPGDGLPSGQPGLYFLSQARL